MIAIFSDSKEVTASQVAFLNVTLTTLTTAEVNM